MSYLVTCVNSPLCQRSVLAKQYPWTRRTTNTGSHMCSKFLPVSDVSAAAQTQCRQQLLHWVASSVQTSAIV